MKAATKAIRFLETLALPLGRQWENGANSRLVKY